MKDDPHRLYVRTLLGSLAIAAIPLIWLWFWLEPLSGDLTRLGWYAERDFGWRLPQERFARSLAALGPYDRHYDVVVIGDSFSVALGQSASAPADYWHNYVSETTGLSILALHFSESSLFKVVRSPVFASAPPKLLIYEWVERDLDGFASEEISGTDCSPRARAPVEIPAFHRYDAPKINAPRPTVSWDINLGYARRYAVKAALRAWFGIESANVKLFALSRGGLFSSAEDRSLLVYKDDLRKARWKNDALERTYCRMVSMQNLVEANGQTRLLLMIVPDKLTAYSEYVREEQHRKLSKLASFLDEHSLPAPRLDISLTAAISRGEVDVYLPDGTHWGYRGHQIAAQTLVEYIK